MAADRQAARRGVLEAESVAKLSPDMSARLDDLASARLVLGEILGEKDETRDEGITSLRLAVSEAGKAGQSVPSIPWYRWTLSRSWAAIARTLKSQGKIAEARTSYDEAMRAAGFVTSAIPGIAYLDTNMTDLKKERQELGEGP